MPGLPSVPSARPFYFLVYLVPGPFISTPGGEILDLTGRIRLDVVVYEHLGGGDNMGKIAVVIWLFIVYGRDVQETHQNVLMTTLVQEVWQKHMSCCFPIEFDSFCLTSLSVPYWPWLPTTTVTGRLSCLQTVCLARPQMTHSHLGDPSEMSKPAKTHAGLPVTFRHPKGFDNLTVYLWWLGTASHAPPPPYTHRLWLTLVTHWYGATGHAEKVPIQVWGGASGYTTVAIRPGSHCLECIANRIHYTWYSKRHVDPCRDVALGKPSVYVICITTVDTGFAESVLVWVTSLHSDTKKVLGSVNEQQRQLSSMPPCP